MDPRAQDDRTALASPERPGRAFGIRLGLTLPGYDLVCKVIKDRFDPPKNTSRQAVMQKYQLVFKHDRVG